MLTFVSFRDSSDEEQASLEETAVTSLQPGQSIGEKRGKERKGITISISNQDHSLGINGQTGHQNVEINNRV
ncbi:hypothetical protein cypCar_00004481 [Cyprinus carpio]|nr:hypothetical protein cypCar_00004481 [Cyprinus carpio]